MPFQISFFPTIKVFLVVQIGISLSFMKSRSSPLSLIELNRLRFWKGRSVHATHWSLSNVIRYTGICNIFKFRKECNSVVTESALYFQHSTGKKRKEKRKHKVTRMEQNGRPYQDRNGTYQKRNGTKQNRMEKSTVQDRSKIKRDKAVPIISSAA